MITRMYSSTNLAKQLRTPIFAKMTFIYCHFARLNAFSRQRHCTGQKIPSLSKCILIAGGERWWERSPLSLWEPKKILIRKWATVMKRMQSATFLQKKCQQRRQKRKGEKTKEYWNAGRQVLKAEMAWWSSRWISFNDNNQRPMRRSSSSNCWEG